MKKLIAILCVGLAAASSVGFAQTAAPKYTPPTLEEFFKFPQLSGLRISPNGEHFAAVAPVKGRLNLVIIDVKTRNALAITGYEEFDVTNVHWVGNDRLVYSLGKRGAPTGAGQFEGGGFFSVSRDGKEGRNISPTVRETRNSGQTVYRAYSYSSRVPGSDEEIIAEGNFSDAQTTDLYRLNVRTGRANLITSGRPASYINDWVLDSKKVPRVAVASIKDTLTRVIYYRKNGDSPWSEIYRYDLDKGPILVPIGFEADDKTLQVASDKDRETMAVVKYDPETKTLGEVVARHPRYDMGADQRGNEVSGVVYFNESIKGYRVDAAKPETVWLDERYAKVQALIDKALPNLTNVISQTRIGDRWLINSYSDVSYPRWYLLDEQKMTLEDLAASKPWLDNKLVQQRPFMYKTRDGLEISGYYFLPADYKPGTKLPTIVHIHGGPSVRADSWATGFGYLEGQLFASRGYAVVVPNFRVTPGLGGKIFYKGFGTYGRQMSEDHEDALAWAINEGFADSKRACISGASYGGYAALQALVKTPDLFKCAIAGLAVTDLEYQLTTADSDFYGSIPVQTLWRGIVGVDSWSSDLSRSLSPVNNADKIKGAVFLYAGRDDVRVPIRQIDRMASALNRAGNPVKGFVLKNKEGHGFGVPENNVDLYTQIFKFLKDNL